MEEASKKPVQVDKPQPPKREPIPFRCAVDAGYLLGPNPSYTPPWASPRLPK